MSASVEPLISEQATAVWRRALPRSNGAADSRPTSKESKRVAYVLVDLLLIIVNAAVVFSSRFLFNFVDLSRKTPYANVFHPALIGQIGFLAVYAVLLLLTMQSEGMYRSARLRSVLEDSFAVTRSVLLATLLLTAVIYLSGVNTVSRILFVFTATADWATLILWRWWFRGVVERRVQRGEGSRNTLIVGAGELGQTIAQYLEEHKDLGYVVKGCLDSNQDTANRWLGKIEDFPQIARAHFIDEVLIVASLDRETISKVVWNARQQRIDVKIVPDLLLGLGRRTRWDYVGNVPVIEVHKEPIPTFALVLKRVSDIIISTIALIVTGPIMAACAVAIRLDTPGPILYRSWRVGKKGKRFTCYKFRTMVEDAEGLKDNLAHLNEREGILFKISNDPRLTRVGKILRKYSLDELPQFWNVLKGDMSLVGPRPPVVSEYEQYGLEHLRRMDVTPGITGLWQVSARRDPSFEKYVALDLEYIENWNVWLDLRIALQTVPAVLKGTGR